MQTSDDWGSLLFRSNQWKGEKNLIPKNQRVVFFTRWENISWHHRLSNDSNSQTSWNSLRFASIWSFFLGEIHHTSTLSGGAAPTPTCFRTLCAKTLPMPAPAVDALSPKIHWLIMVHDDSLWKKCQSEPQPKIFQKKIPCFQPKIQTTRAIWISWI